MNHRPLPRLLLALVAASFAVISASAQSAGGRILFVSDRDERVGLYQMNADGTDASLLREDAGAAVFSPDGSKIAFLARPGNGPREIFIMNADGSGVTQVTQSEGNPQPHPDFPGEVVFGPESISFHPAGDRVVFSDQGEIYVAPIDGSLTRQQVTVGNSGDLTDKETPVFSRDGRRIVFVGLIETEDEPDSGIFDLNWDLYAMNADGSGLTRLTDHPADDLAPAFSYDGTRILFVRQNDPSGELASSGLYTIGSGGGAPTRIAADPSLSYVTAVFAGNDSRILFGANTNTGEGARTFSQSTLMEPTSFNSPTGSVTTRIQLSVRGRWDRRSASRWQMAGSPKGPPERRRQCSPCAFPRLPMNP